MVGPTKTYFIAFGPLTIAGGVLGCPKARNAIALLAGTIGGILLLVAAFLMPAHAGAGLTLGGLVSLLLIGYFLPAFFRTHQITPAGIRSVPGILGVVFAMLAWMRE